jgi:hypothetical protein
MKVPGKKRGKEEGEEEERGGKSRRKRRGKGREEAVRLFSFPGQAVRSTGEEN